MALPRVAFVAVVLAAIAASAEAAQGRKLLQANLKNFTGNVCAWDGDSCAASSGFIAASAWKPEGRLALGWQRYHQVEAGCSLGTTESACKEAASKLEKKLGSRFSCTWNSKASTCGMADELKADFGKTTTQWWLAACPNTPLQADINCWFNTNDTKSCAAAGSECVWVAKDAPSKSGAGRPAGCYSKARASATPEEFEAFLAKANSFDPTVVGSCDSIKALKTGQATGKACSALTKKAECAAKADCNWSGSACTMSQTAMAGLIGAPKAIMDTVKACAAKTAAADCTGLGKFTVALAV